MSYFKVLKNDEGIYRVQFYRHAAPVGKRQDGFKPREPDWLTDTDLMTAVTGNHRTKILNFNTESSAYQGIADYLRKMEQLQQYAQMAALRDNPPPEPTVSDTFREV